MIVLTEELYNKFVAKELTLDEVETATQVTPVEPEYMSDEQYEKEWDIATKKLNQVIGNKAADLRFGMPLNHPAVQKLIALEKAMGSSQDEAEDLIFGDLANVGYYVVDTEEDQPNLPPYEEFKIPAPCFYWPGII